MKYLLCVLLISIMLGCSASNKVISDNEKIDTKLENDCYIKVEQNMICALSMNDNEVTFNIRIKKPNSYEWAIESIYVKTNEKGFFINGSDDVTMQIGDIMMIESRDINFDGIDDIAISTTFGLANLICDYWLMDKKGNFQFIGNYPYFKVHHDQKTLETKVKISAAEYEQETYHWEGTKLVSDKIISIGPDNISELWESDKDGETK